uniref:Uncharacterized protein n=1 Tax=Poecilia formosa TaxID=48698 RepID=A0A096M6D6_POEFO
ATTKKVLEFMALNEQPFSVVEDGGFRNLMNHLSPQYNVLSLRYFSDVALPEFFSQVIQTHLQSAKSRCKDTLLYDTQLDLNVHVVGNGLERHQVLLQCKELLGSHTAANLSAEFKAMLDLWEICHARVHVVLQDNDRNTAKTLDDANFTSLPCLAHTLQSVGNEIADIVATGRRIVGYFKHSFPYSQLYIIQTQLGQQKKRMPQDASTRWNSTVYMLLSLLDQRRPIGTFAAEHKLPAILSAHQWEPMDNVLTILAPFDQLIKEISSSTATTADVIPAVTALKWLLERQASTDHGVCTAKVTLLEASVRRLSNIEHEPLCIQSTMIDPCKTRYKNHF